MFSIRYIVSQFLKRVSIVLIIMLITYFLMYPTYRTIVISTAYHAAAVAAYMISQHKALSATQMKALIHNIFCNILSYRYHICYSLCGCHVPEIVNEINLLGYYLWSFLTFNFPPCSADYSSLGFTGTNTAAIIAQAIPRTVLLLVTSVIVGYILAITIGSYIANKRGSLADNVVTIISMITWSFPVFYIAMIMIYVFAIEMKIFPPGRMMSIPPPTTPLGIFLDVLWHLALPMITLAFMHFGGGALIVRSLLLDVLREDYILTARAKGVPERRILYNHALRAALPSIVVMAAIALAEAFGGAIVTEMVFNWPGMGLLYWRAIEYMDPSMIMAVTYVTVLIYAVTLFIADLLVLVLDPRLRRG